MWWLAVTNSRTPRLPRTTNDQSELVGSAHPTFCEPSHLVGKATQGSPHPLRMLRILLEVTTFVIAPPPH